MSAAGDPDSGQVISAVKASWLVPGEGWEGFRLGHGEGFLVVGGLHGWVRFPACLIPLGDLAGTQDRGESVPGTTRGSGA